MAGALTIVETNLEWYKIAITAIQEVRWIGDGNLKSNNFTVFYSDGQRHERWVGFIINNEYLPYIKQFEPYSDRLCYIKLEFNINKLLCAYRRQATRRKLSILWRSQYYIIYSIYESIPKNHPKIILGDLNAKVGKRKYTDQQLEKKAFTHTPTITVTD